MSRAVAALVYSRKCGSMSRKAVLAYFSERANDDGSGIWASKSRIADEIECSKQTVIRTVQALEADGLIEAVGKHRTQGGYTVIYNMNLAAIAALESAQNDAELTVNQSHSVTGPNTDQSHSVTPTSHTVLPKPSMNRPSPTETTSLPEKRAKPKRTPKSDRPIPEGWEPVLTQAAQRMVDQWPEGMFDRELQKFINHAADKGRKSKDWQAAFRTWLGNQDGWMKERNHGQANRTTGSSNGLLNACIN